MASDILSLSRLSFYDNKPMAYLYQGPSQSIPNSSYTPLTFDTVSIDNWGGWSAGDPTKYTVKVAGKYKVSAMVYFAANATGGRFLRLLYNTAAVFGSIGEDGNPSASNSQTVISPPVIIQASVGDFFQAAAFQASGGALATIAGSANTSSMTVEFLSF